MQANSVLIVGKPWESPEISWKNAIWTIIKGVLEIALMINLVIIENMLKFVPFLTWSSVNINLQINWNEHEKVMTQAEDPTGAPKILSRIGASVSCQVHHKNLAPKV